MLTNKTIGFIGAGNMAEALIKGLISSGKISPAQIIVSDMVKERLAYIAEEYEIKVFNKNFEVARGADIVFFALKPFDMEGVVTKVAGELSPDKLIVSIAAGVTTEKLHMWLRAGGLRDDIAVVRAMPNTPALVAQGAIGITPGRCAGKKDLELTKQVLAQVGRVVVFDDESHLNAVTGLSGSGPAFVFLFMEAMCEAGIKSGLTPEDAKTLSLQTTLGAARLAQESDKDLKELRDMVTSPAGTTIEGLKKLEEKGFYDIVIDAVRCATKRAGELSNG